MNSSKSPSQIKTLLSLIEEVETKCTNSRVSDSPSVSSSTWAGQTTKNVETSRIQDSSFCGVYKSAATAVNVTVPSLGPSNNCSRIDDSLENVPPVINEVHCSQDNVGTTLNKCIEKLHEISRNTASLSSRCNLKLPNQEKLPVPAVAYARSYSIGSDTSAQISTEFEAKQPSPVPVPAVKKTKKNRRKKGRRRMRKRTTESVNRLQPHKSYFSDIIQLSKALRSCNDTETDLWNQSRDLHSKQDGLYIQGIDRNKKLSDLHFQTVKRNSAVRTNKALQLRLGKLIDKQLQDVKDASKQIKLLRKRNTLSSLPPPLPTITRNLSETTVNHSNQHQALQVNTKPSLIPIRMNEFKSTDNRITSFPQLPKHVNKPLLCAKRTFHLESQHNNQNCVNNSKEASENSTSISVNNVEKGIPSAVTCATVDNVDNVTKSTDQLKFSTALSSTYKDFTLSNERTLNARSVPTASISTPSRELSVAKVIQDMELKYRELHRSNDELDKVHSGITTRAPQNDSNVDDCRSRDVPSLSSCSVKQGRYLYTSPSSLTTTEPNSRTDSKDGIIKMKTKISNALKKTDHLIGTNAFNESKNQVLDELQSDLSEAIACVRQLRSNASLGVSKNPLKVIDEWACDKKSVDFFKGDGLVENFIPNVPVKQDYCSGSVLENFTTDFANGQWPCKISESIFNIPQSQQTTNNRNTCSHNASKDRLSADQQTNSMSPSCAMSNSFDSPRGQSDLSGLSADTSDTDVGGHSADTTEDLPIEVTATWTNTNDSFETQTDNAHILPLQLYFSSEFSSNNDCALHKEQSKILSISSSTHEDINASRKLQRTDSSSDRAIVGSCPQDSVLCLSLPLSDSFPTVERDKHDIDIDSTFSDKDDIVTVSPLVSEVFTPDNSLFPTTQIENTKDYNLDYNFFLEKSSDDKVTEDWNPKNVPVEVPIAMSTNTRRILSKCDIMSNINSYLHSLKSQPLVSTCTSNSINSPSKNASTVIDKKSKNKGYTKPPCCIKTTNNDTDEVNWDDSDSDQESEGEEDQDDDNDDEDDEESVKNQPGQINAKNTSKSSTSPKIESEEYDDPFVEECEGMLEIDQNSMSMHKTLGVQETNFLMSKFLSRKVKEIIDRPISSPDLATRLRQTYPCLKPGQFRTKNEEENEWSIYVDVFVRKWSVDSPNFQSFMQDNAEEDCYSDAVLHKWTKTCRMFWPIDKPFHSVISLFLARLGIENSPYLVWTMKGFHDDEKVEEDTELLPFNTPEDLELENGSRLFLVYDPTVLDLNPDGDHATSSSAQTGLTDGSTEIWSGTTETGTLNDEEYDCEFDNEDSDSDNKVSSCSKSYTKSKKKKEDKAWEVDKDNEAVFNDVVVASETFSSDNDEETSKPLSNAFAVDVPMSTDTVPLPKSSKSPAPSALKTGQSSCCHSRKKNSSRDNQQHNSKIQTSSSNYIKEPGTTSNTSPPNKLSFDNDSRHVDFKIPSDSSAKTLPVLIEYKDDAVLDEATSDNDKNTLKSNESHMNSNSCISNKTPCIPDKEVPILKNVIEDQTLSCGHDSRITIHDCGPAKKRSKVQNVSIKDLLQSYKEQQQQHLDNKSSVPVMDNCSPLTAGTTPSLVSYSPQKFGKEVHPTLNPIVEASQSVSRNSVTPNFMTSTAGATDKELSKVLVRLMSNQIDSSPRNTVPFVQQDTLSKSLNSKSKAFDMTTSKTNSFDAGTFGETLSHESVQRLQDIRIKLNRLEEMMKLHYLHSDDTTIVTE